MIHFMTDITRKEGSCTTHTIDGYTTRKTILGAAHEIGKAIAKIDAGEGELLLSAKTEREAKDLLVKNTGSENYCFELEEVPCACEWDEETDETKYEDGHFYFLIRFFVWEATEEPEVEENEPETILIVEPVDFSHLEDEEEDEKESRITIQWGIPAGREVWTGYPGQYETAPEEPGTYRLVEYYQEDENGRRVHDCFEFIREA